MSPTRAFPITIAVLASLLPLSGAVDPCLTYNNDVADLNLHPLADMKYSYYAPALDPENCEPARGGQSEVQERGSATANSIYDGFDHLSQECTDGTVTSRVAQITITYTYSSETWERKGDQHTGAGVGTATLSGTSSDPVTSIAGDADVYGTDGQAHTYGMTAVDTGVADLRVDGRVVSDAVPGPMQVYCTAPGEPPCAARGEAARTEDDVTLLVQVTIQKCGPEDP